MTAYYEHPTTGELEEHTGTLAGTLIVFLFDKKADYVGSVELTHFINRFGPDTVHVYAKDRAHADRVGYRVVDERAVAPSADAPVASPEPVTQVTDSLGYGVLVGGYTPYGAVYIEEYYGQWISRVRNCTNTAFVRFAYHPTREKAIAWGREQLDALDPKHQSRADALADRCGQLQHERDEAMRRAEAAEAKLYRSQRRG